MDKVATFVVLLLASIIVCSAAQNSRALRQESGLYNCGGIRKLGESQSSNKCCQLCWCLGNQSPNKMLAGSSLQNFCQQQCSQCVAAAYDSDQCPDDNSPLPDVCKRGLQFNAMVKGLVDKCANMYFNDNSSLDRALGC